MRIEKITKQRDGKEEDRIICDPRDDSCPVCETPLEGVTFRPTAFDGEEEASCCHVRFLTRSCLDRMDEQHGGRQNLRQYFGQHEIDFVQGLNNPHRIMCMIVNADALPIIRQALLDTGERYLYVDGKENIKVFERVNALLREAERHG